MNNKIFKIFLFFLVFVSTCLEAQNPAVKIYVADAETGKSISNAKVCLEGFEIPAIKAQYNKKEKYYYFTEISKNYNTVMVYHKKYNEKGFQDINGLPKELKFKLHEPLQNYYDFDYKTYDEYPNKKFYNYYVEDPYKIVIEPKDGMSYNDFRNYIYNYIKKNDVSIVPINPYLNKYNANRNLKSERIDQEPYPYLYSRCLYSAFANCFDKRDNNLEFIFPLYYGTDVYGWSKMHKDLKSYPEEICIFFMKKKGEKFKRFNDPIIDKLSKNKNIQIYFVVNHKGSIYGFGDKDFTPQKFFKNRDEKNIELNKKHKKILPSLFMYDNTICIHDKESKGIIMDNSSDGCARGVSEDFTLIERKVNPFKLSRNSFEEEKEDSLSFNINDGIGLGFLDLYEINFNKIKK